MPPLNPMYYSLDSIAINAGQIRMYSPPFGRFTADDCDDVLEWLAWLTKRYTRLRDRLNAEQPKS